MKIMQLGLCDATKHASVCFSIKTRNMKNIQHVNSKNVPIDTDTTCLFEFTLKLQ